MPKSYKYLALLALSITACLGCRAEPSATGTTHMPRYAKNFEITHFPTHRIATIRNIQRGSTGTHQYALVPKGAPLPDLPSDMPVIRTPIKRVVVMETVYIGYLDALGKLDTIIGAATADYISNATVRAAIDNGSIKKVQIGAALNIERMLLLQPELILTSISGDPAFDIPAKLARSGLPVVLSAGYMEQHPLARSEWIKFIAAFFDADAEANHLFDGIATRYESLSQKAATIEQRPKIFCGAPYSGAWHMASGESYTAQAIRDAGGDYIWADVPGSGAIPLDTERVYLKAAHANIWINPSFYRSLAELYGADARFQKFDAAQSGQVFNNTKQRTTTGGNPIWESGIVHPDDVLADLIKVFHPERMPDWEFIYYEQLK
ncbi:MAG: iron complex transport system substrate-binding protein [Lentimonas sp.]|jgi:iron complex transport system substrate-binding protein